MLVVLVVCYCFYFLVITVSSALITVSSALSSYYCSYFLLITVSSSTLSDLLLSISTLGNSKK